MSAESFELLGRDIKESAHNALPEPLGSSLDEVTPRSCGTASAPPTKLQHSRDYDEVFGEIETDPGRVIETILTSGTKISKNEVCDLHGPFTRPGWHYGDWTAWQGSRQCIPPIGTKVPAVRSVKRIQSRFIKTGKRETRRVMMAAFRFVIFR